MTNGSMKNGGGGGNGKVPASEQLVFFTCSLNCNAAACASRVSNDNQPIAFCGSKSRVKNNGAEAIRIFEQDCPYRATLTITVKAAAVNAAPSGAADDSEA